MTTLTESSSKRSRSQLSSGSSFRPVAPALSDSYDEDKMSEEPLTASIGEQLFSDYSVHELPDENVRDGTNLTLSARVDALEAETRQLKAAQASQKAVPWRISCITNDDELVRFYTGFVSYEVLLVFYEFLGPSVNELHYWGKNIPSRKHTTLKLDPLKQLFLTLVKLRLNHQERDLACRFGISISLVSRYFSTWICFLYHHMKEIDWMPSPSQVASTLPPAFKEGYSSTFAIVDASEIFLETPSDLRLQSTWSSYKHHNTAELLVCCTPNGVISFVSPLYVGGISDVELTRVSGLLDKLADKPGVSVMADRGFTIRDQLDPLNIKLNIPLFMEGRRQLPAEVKSGRIASLRIHVERAIGRIKNFSILKNTLPITMARIANQIVSVHGLPTSSQLLFPSPVMTTPTLWRSTLNPFTVVIMMLTQSSVM